MIYLDNNATTQLDPSVAKLLQNIISQQLGNPSSIHSYGRAAKNLLYPAIDCVAESFSVKKSELIFTSGATEAINMAILGLGICPHIITSAIEHLAVLEPIQRMEKKGAKVTRLWPQGGCITLRQVTEAINPATKLIALSWANNETGILTDIEGIAALCEERGILFLVDGVALLGKERCHIPAGVSAICFSGHKIHGPVGIGLAIVRKRHVLDPLIMGGPQQNGRRGGTENVAAIVAFAESLKRLNENLDQDIMRMKELQKRFEEGLKGHIPRIIIHGENERRVCNTSSVCFPGIDGEELLMRLDLAGVAASLGSACSAGALEPSRVLLNMGISPILARSTLRFSISRFTTEDEIDRALAVIKSCSQ
jgi:cysteine desulfurase